MSAHHCSEQECNYSDSDCPCFGPEGHAEGCPVHCYCYDAPFSEELA